MRMLVRVCVLIPILSDAQLSKTIVPIDIVVDESVRDTMVEGKKLSEWELLIRVALEEVLKHALDDKSIMRWDKESEGLLKGKYFNRRLNTLGKSNKTQQFN